MRSSRVLAFFLTVLFSACTSAASVPDAPTPDAPTPDGGVSAPTDGGGGEGGMCSGADGVTTCSGGYGMTCCRGITQSFADGPCFPRPDAGLVGTGCDVDPSGPGCACTTEGAPSCPTGSWRRTCRGGVWVEEFGFMCCAGS